MSCIRKAAMSNLIVVDVLQLQIPRLVSFSELSVVILQSQFHHIVGRIYVLEVCKAFV